MLGGAMFFMESKTSQEVIDQYFSSGYSSLTQLLEKCVNADVLLFEKDPAATYEGTALREHASRLSDFLPAKHKLS